MNYEEQYKQDAALFNSITNRFDKLTENDVIGAYSFK